MARWRCEPLADGDATVYGALVGAASARLRPAAVSLGRPLRLWRRTRAWHGRLCLPQHRMARHDQSRLACVGWMLCVQLTAIAPYHPIYDARLYSWLKARAKSSARVPRRSQGAEGAFDLGGWASRHFTEVPARRSASTELEPFEPDRAPDLIGAYGRRISNTNHVPFTSFRVEWASGASAPECGVAGGGDGCHAGRPASIWDLRSAGRSYNGREWCIPPLSSLRRCVSWRHAPWPLGHVHSASRRPPHEHTAWHGEKARQ